MNKYTDDNGKELTDEEAVALGFGTSNRCKISIAIRKNGKLYELENECDPTSATSFRHMCEEACASVMRLCDS